MRFALSIQLWFDAKSPDEAEGFMGDAELELARIAGRRSVGAGPHGASVVSGLTAVDTAAIEAMENEDLGTTTHSAMHKTSGA